MGSPAQGHLQVTQYQAARTWEALSRSHSAEASPLTDCEGSQRVVIEAVRSWGGLLLNNRFLGHQDQDRCSYDGDRAVQCEWSEAR